MKDLYRSKKLDRLISLGDSIGSALATATIRALPLGVPKIRVSIMAGAPGAKTYIGTTDIVLMPSVADIAGLNRITRRILANAVGAIVGMAEVLII